MPRLHLLTDKQLENLIKNRIALHDAEVTRDFERDLLIKQANISALQSQINPHFLYNTLECIRGQALIAGEDDIASTAFALSCFFRYSISSKSNTATLREELDNIDNYFTIQRYRFRDRFQVKTICVESYLLNAYLPKLLLQPIVENSIIHGFSSLTNGGLIEITISLLPNSVMSIVISDNGKGIAPDTLAALCRKIRTGESNDDTQRSGIGMWNVDRRLKLFYGDEFGLSIYSTEGVGTRVEIILPCVFSDTL